MPALRAIRLLNAIEAGTTTGDQLESLLVADPGRVADLNSLFVQRGTMRRMLSVGSTVAALGSSAKAMGPVVQNPEMLAAVIANSSAMAAIVANADSMSVVIGSAAAMTGILAAPSALTAMSMSAVAMTAVWAADTAADAMLGGSVGRLAIYNSDIALTALQANPAQVQRRISSASTGSTSGPLVLVANGTKVILLRRYYSAAYDIETIDWARGSVTAAFGQGPVGGSRNLDTNASATGCVLGSYTSNGASPTTNDATGNFVSAANGLQRRSAGGGSTLTVKYIVV